MDRYGARTGTPALPFCHAKLKAEKPRRYYPRELRRLGDYLRKRRLDLGLLQKQAAQQIGVNYKTLYGWETNRTSPVLRFIPQIIGFLGYVPSIGPQPKTLGEQIAARRWVLGLSREALATQFGVDPSTVADWEKGRNRPTEKSLETIEAFFWEMDTGYRS